MGSERCIRDRQYAERGYKASRKDQAGNRLAAMAGVGQTATNDTANLGSQYASSVSANNNNAARATGDAAIAAGNAKASSYVNTANSINSGVQNLAYAYLYNPGFGGGSTRPSYAGYRA